MKIALLVLIGAVVVSSFGLVGGMDYETNVAEADMYCQEVYNGLQGDYKGTYDKDCRNGRYQRTN